MFKHWFVLVAFISLQTGNCLPLVVKEGVVGAVDRRLIFQINRRSWKLCLLVTVQVNTRKNTVRKKQEQAVSTVRKR